MYNNKYDRISVRTSQRRDISLSYTPKKKNELTKIQIFKLERVVVNEF